MRYLYYLALLFWGAFLPAQDLYFPSVTSDNWETISLEDAGFCPDNEQDLYDFLEGTNTDAFLLLKDGRIVLERYFGDFTSATPHAWNSAGKSLMAFAVGIAADLDSVDLQAPTSDYLGVGWTDCPDTEPDIRVVHQLTMTTGLSDLTGDPYCTDPGCLVCLAEPGERWAYHNGPYTLLGRVLESATGEPLNDFIQDRIRQPTGMTGQYIYLDDNRVFFSNARSMARFGLLMLGGGSWNGTPLLRDEGYFNAMINSSQELNPAYGYLWWLNGKSSFKLPQLQIDFNGPLLTEAPTDMYAALGKNSQIINVVPSEGLVVVRMGDDPESSLVQTSYNNDLWGRINAMRCTTSDFEPAVNLGVSAFPNPAADRVTLTAERELRAVSIYSVNGRLLRQLPLSGTNASIPTADLPRGILYLRVVTADGTVVLKIMTN